jgi:hypothetical protein
MLPVAQDFIGKDGQVSAYGNQLIVNAEPARSTNCAPCSSTRHRAKRLLITVDTNETTTVAKLPVNGANRTRPASSATAPPAAMAACSRSRPAKACRR